jgi:hypothetical protein
MRRHPARAAALLLATCVLTAPAAAQTITLGQQDFANGAFTDLGAFNTAGAGEAAPFNAFQGGDPSGSANASFAFTFNYPSLGSITGATLTFGIFDLDSQASGSQIASFVLNGSQDLTALLDAASEASPAAQLEVRVFSLALPSSVFASLAGGTAAFTLTLQGPSLGVSGELPNNGAGLDFATLQLNTSTVPEPSTWALLGTGLLAVAGVAARRRRSTA